LLNINPNACFFGAGSGVNCLLFIFIKYIMIIMKKTVTISPSVLLLISFASVAVLIALSWEWPSPAFEISIRLIPVILVWLFICAAAVSSVVICIFSKNAVTKISAVCVSVSLIIAVAVLTAIDWEDRMRRGQVDMGIDVIIGEQAPINEAITHFRSILFWCAACVAAVSAIIFVVSLFIKRSFPRQTGNRKEQK
jgi:hypothetical protein